jgi:sulfide:quinone oxidoreductase
MTSSEAAHQPLRVVVAGGGVAGLETIMALHDLAGRRVSVELICPDTEFLYKPLAVAEPFAHRSASRHSLERIAADFCAKLTVDALDWVAPGQHAIFTRSGAEIGYDVLVVALGARREQPFDQVVTFRGHEDSEAVHGLVQDIEHGYSRKIAFVVPPGVTWPLPLYELALMAAARAHEMQVEVDLHLVTPEETPLAAFGGEASAEVAAMLHDAGVAVETGAYAEVEGGRTVHLRPSGRSIEAHRVVAVPVLHGTAPRGVPATSDGFIPVDTHGRVTGASDVYAAGDGVAFPIKQGGIATQQADAIAEVIAKRAGASLEPRGFHPAMRGIVLTGGKERYLRGDVSRGRDVSEASDHPLWWPPAKIAGRYLAPYLAGELGDAKLVPSTTGAPPVKRTV